jgi:hypothetical protein
LPSRSQTEIVGWLGLSDLAGLFSRKFVVGFFIPVFFASLAWAQLVDSRTMPGVYRDASKGTQILVLGGFAVLVGYLLSGVHYSAVRFLEGYWLQAPSIPPPPDLAITKAGRTFVRTRSRMTAPLVNARYRLGDRMRQRWVREFRWLSELDRAPEVSPQRTAASRRLNSEFPAQEANLLPTRFGNVIRPFETYPRQRYSLDGIAAWPRIATLLSDGERTELEDATTDLAFWLNWLLSVTVSGVALFAERLWHRPGGVFATIGVELAVIAATTLLATWMYRQSISAAARWGQPVRAGFDMHRLGLYETLGLRAPLTQEQEQENARAIGRLVAFGERLPDQTRVAAGSSDEHEKTPGPGPATSN